MQPSRHLFVMGVGVLVVLSGMPPGLSEPTPNQAPTASKSDKLQPISLPETTVSSESASHSPPKPTAAKPVPSKVVVAPVVPKTISTRGSAPTKDSTLAISRQQPAIAQTAAVTNVKQPAIAQATPSPAPNLAPAPGGTPSPAPTPTPVPGGITQPPLSTPDPGPSRPLGPAKPGKAPDYLNPDPNPLSFPTKPEEVRLRGIQPITLQQAIELAQRNNRSLQVSRLQLERSRAALRESQAANFPTLSAQTSLGRSQSASGGGQNNNALSQLLGRQTNTDSPVNNTFSASATLSYDIFTSGRRPATIRAAERQLRSDELQVEINQEQLRFDVAGDYYNLQQNDEAVRIQQASVRNNEASLRDTLALERAGLGTRFDVLQSQVQLANARQNLTNAIAQQQISRRQLAQRLSLSPAVDLAAADPVDVAGEWNLSLEESIVLALKNRAELEQQLVQREQAQQQRRAALATLKPNVTAQAQYSLADNLNDDIRIGDGYAFQLGANWTLFDGGAAVAQARQAEANIAIAEQTFADQSNQVRFAVEQGYANLLSNFENIGTTTQALGQAQEALRLARLRFQAGVGTSTDVINAENALTNAEGNRVNAVIGYNRSLSSLQRAVTNLPIATGATTPSLASPGGRTPSNPSVPNTSSPNTTPTTTPIPDSSTPNSSPPATQTP
ncbi:MULTISPECIES: TolC family protein [Cyanophyceae]|uniref:TolC family protein n=1 Tax=Stenomitos frigidus AS-A4 TaxID=2933935 RepID=A0ABV0KM18_9CYAN|nr:TolC family protein [Phormidium sp. FACHB-592]